MKFKGRAGPGPPSEIDLPDSDESLARSAAQGDQEAFERLVIRHRELVYRVARKIVGNDDDALDVTQETYQKLVRKIGGWRGKGPVRGWIIVICVNEARSFVRKAARRRTIHRAVFGGAAAGAPAPDHAADLPGGMGGDRHRTVSGPTGGSGGVPAPLLRQDFDNVVRRAVAPLPPQQKAICLLRFLEDMGPSEIGRALSIPASQVRSQFARAVRTLRESEALREWLAPAASASRPGETVPPPPEPHTEEVSHG